MRILSILGLTSVCAIAALVPVTAASSTAPAPSGATTAVLAYADAFDTPGVAAAVITDAGVETVLSGRDGAGAPVTAQAPFRIASMSKSMTATAIMLLVQDGELALDDPVADVLPEFEMADLRYRSITVRQLLSHTSGLSLRTNDEFALPVPPDTTSVVAELRDRRLAADPGHRFEYHNTNYSLAARIVEVLSGRPLSEFLEHRLFRPLGMSDSISVDRCDDAVDGLTEGYSVVLGYSWVMPEMPGRCGGNGGVVSTLDDMVRWIRFNQGAIGTAILEPALLAELHQAQPGAAQFALGWERHGADETYPISLVSHGGTLATFTGSMAFAPATGTAAVVLTNAVGSPGDLVRNLIASAEGEQQLPFENPLDTVNAILLGLVLIAAALLVGTAVRGPLWAAGRRTAEHPRTLVRLIPLGVVIVIGLFVPLLPALLGGSINWQYWVIDLWLFPVLAALGTVLVIGGISALVSRIVSLRLNPGSRGTSQPRS